MQDQCPLVTGKRLSPNEWKPSYSGRAWYGN